jgi:hypothetical protein
MRRTAIVVALAIGFALPSTNSGRAQIAMPQPISTPVPDKWREPFEVFLGDMKVGDPKALVAKTSAFEIGGVWQKDWILFRIEDPKTCHDDLCFTVIGRIVDGKFVANAMFTAGKRFTRGDVFIPMFGFQVLPAWLFGNSVSVSLLETPKGWTIAPDVTSKEFLDVLQGK